MALQDDDERGVELRVDDVDDPIGHLLHGEIEVEGRMPYSSNATFLVHVTHDGASHPAIYKPTRGEVMVHQPQGRSYKINGYKPNRVTTIGMARTFQNIRLFQNMTVLENVMIGRHCRTTTNILGAILRGKNTNRQERETIERSYELLEKVGLVHFADEFAKNLPYGAQRRLEIARAMATDPFLLLLDEPAAGMNPQETKDLDELIVRIKDTENISILLIEHDMKLVMNISERIYVMEYGKKIAHGSPQEIRSNPKVIEAYLGEGGDDA